MNITQTDIMIILPAFFLMIGLSCVVVIDTIIPELQKNLMLLINAFIFSLIFQNILDNYFSSESPIVFRLMVSVYGYWIRPVIITLFIKLLKPYSRHTAAWILTGSNFLIYMTTFFTSLTIWYDQENHFHRGPLGFTCHIVSFILLIWMLYMNTQVFRHEKGFENAIPFLSAGMIIAATLADVLIAEPYYISYLTQAIIVSCVFYYFWLHLQMNRQYQQAMLAEQRIQIMMSQIQPHFIFNTLSTIQALCLTDPKKAFDTLGKFGIYLRLNLESLNKTNLIPIHQELKHTKVYAEIEMIRFPSIKVNYDIEDEEFLLPALTIQPLVENAIRHGVRIRKNGEITVTSRQDGDYHLITIRDNGKGFDVEQVMQADESHIGIRNVRERIERMCGGQMIIDSRIGEGTLITIRIPVDNRKENVL